MRPAVGPLRAGGVADTDVLSQCSSGPGGAGPAPSCKDKPWPSLEPRTLGADAHGRQVGESALLSRALEGES